MNQRALLSSICDTINEFCYNPETKTNNWRGTTACQFYGTISHGYDADGRVNAISVNGKDLFCNEHITDELIGDIRRAFQGTTYHDRHISSNKYHRYTRGCHELGNVLLDYHYAGIVRYLREESEIEPEWAFIAPYLKNYDSAVDKLYDAMIERAAATDKTFHGPLAFSGVFYRHYGINMSIDMLSKSSISTIPFTVSKRLKTFTGRAYTAAPCMIGMLLACQASGDYQKFNKYYADGVPRLLSDVISAYDAID